MWDEKDDRNQVFVGNLEWFKEKVIILQKELNIKTDEKLWKFDHSFYEFIIKTGFYCYHINTVVLEREILQNVGLFNENLKMSEDLDFLYRILSKYSLVTINRSHFVYYFGTDNLFAFAGRKNNFDELSFEIKERLYQNLKNKVKFYQLLDDYLITLYDVTSFKDPDAVFDSIYFNIVKRCLTIILLKEKEVNKINFYYSLAKKYARNTYLQYLLENYKADGVRSQYFGLC